MKNLLSLFLCTLVITILSSNVLGQELTTTNNTGDAEMDSYLAEINDKAESDYDSFRDELSESSEITSKLEPRRLE